MFKLVFVRFLAASFFKITVFLKKLAAKTINLFQVQLMLYAITLPFAIFWGLSISPLSMITTILGTPIVFLIIIFTLLIYLCTAFGFKLFFLSFILNKLCFIWEKFINYQIRVQLLVAPNISTNFLIFSTLFFIFIYYLIKKNKYLSIFFSFFYILLIFLVSHLFNNPPKFLQINGANIYYDQELKIVISKIPKNYSSWHFRVLVAELRKKYGRNSPDVIIINKLDGNKLLWLKEILIEKFVLKISVFKSEPNLELISLAKDNGCILEFN